MGILLLGQRLVQQPGRFRTDAGGLGGLQPPRHRRQALGQILEGIGILLLGQRLIENRAASATRGRPRRAPAAPPPPPDPRPTACGLGHPSPGPTPGSATWPRPHRRGRPRRAPAAPPPPPGPRPTPRGHWHPSPGPAPGSATGRPRRAPAAPPPPPGPRPTAGASRAIRSRLPSPGPRLIQQPGGLGGLQPPRHRRQARGQLPAGTRHSAPGPTPD